MAPFGGVGYVSGKFWQLRFGLVRRGGVRSGLLRQLWRVWLRPVSVGQAMFWQLRRSGVRFSLGRFVKAVMARSRFER